MGWVPVGTGTSSNCQITGVATNLPMHTAVAADAEFSRGALDTDWLSRFARRRVRGAVAGGAGG